MRLSRIFLSGVLLSLVLAVLAGFMPNASQLLAGRLAAFRNISWSGYRPVYSSGWTSEKQKAVNKILPSVVSVYGVAPARQQSGSRQDDSPDSFFPPFPAFLFQASHAARITMGSGFFVDSRGYVLTNKHVVEDASASYSIVLADGRERTADVVYRDPNLDLAIIKIPGQDYPVLPLGDSSKLKKGQTVLGIGNAYGQYPNTVSEGKVVAADKQIFAGGGSPVPLSLIQTSMQLYPGDSGGPLFNLGGEVVGIDMAIAATVPNVSFSIPVNDAKDIIKTVARK